MTDCPHGNTPEERCATCVVSDRAQPGEQWAKRYAPKLLLKQQEADTSIRATNTEQLRRRRAAADSRAAAIASQQQRLEYEQGG